MAIILKNKIVDTVKSILISYPKAKDNDRYINCAVWNRERLNLGITTLDEFFHAYSDGKLTNHDTITRVRRKLQEEFPELRGTSYNKRQNLDPEVSKEMKTYKNN